MPWMFAEQVGAEASAGRSGHSSGCVCGAVVVTVVLCALALGGTSTQTDLLSQLGVCDSADEICETTACVELASELLTNMNTSVDPCEDFFEYTCGGWRVKNPLPDDKTRISTFDQLATAGKMVLKNELESNAGSGTAGKAVRFYAACMDTEAIDEAGVEPLDRLLESTGLAGLPLAAMSAVPGVAANLHNTGGSALFSLYVGGDDHNSTINAVFISQSGLSLPSRDYYIGKEMETDPTLQALMNHIANANHLADPTAVPSAASYLPRAAAVVAFESSLADAMLSRVAQRDPEATYNDMSIAELESLTPNFSWSVYLRALLPAGSARPTRVIVQSPEYLAQMDEIMGAAGLEVVSDYLHWQV